MPVLDQLSVRQKLIWLILIAGGLALLCVALAVVFYESTTFRPRELEELRTSAAVLEKELVAPLRFLDQTSAEDFLKIRRRTRAFAIAAIYDQQGRLFAVARREEFRGELPVKPGTGNEFTARTLSLWQPIRFEGQVIGQLYLIEELPPLYARLPQYSIMLGAVLLALAILQWCSCAACNVTSCARSRVS